MENNMFCFQCEQTAGCGGCGAGRGCGTQPLLSARHAHRYPRAREEGQGVGGLTDGKERRLHGKAF